MADTSKLEAAVGYLAEKLSPGKVKLFKLLFLADFEAHAETGQSITGETYENFEMGPVPTTLWKRFREITSRCAVVNLVETGVVAEQRIEPKPGYRPSRDGSRPNHPVSVGRLSQISKADSPGSGPLNGGHAFNE